MRIDFRSDTITQPTPAMRETMARAEVGDDVFGDDPTVARLEARTAELLGKEAAVFTPPIGAWAWKPPSHRPAFKSDGFEAGTVHWSIRHDGVLGLTAFGSESGHYQTCPSAPALTLDQFGLWVHLAVVIDGGAKQVAHYLNGVPVSEKALSIKPPFCIGAAELGNWNPQGFPRNDPFMIRNFSGSMDEFCLFNRALTASEIRTMDSAGKPQPDPLRQSRN